MEQKIKERLQKLRHQRKLAESNNHISLYQACTAKIEVLTELLEQANEAEPEKEVEGFTSTDLTVSEAKKYMEGKSKSDLDGWLDAEEDRKTLLTAYDELPD